MKVKLLLFAVLRDIVGKDEETIELADGSRAIDLWEMLRRDYEGLEAHRVPPMTAVNESYVTPDTELSEGDEVAFIPPVAGG